MIKSISLLFCLIIFNKTNAQLAEAQFKILRENIQSNVKDKIERDGVLRDKNLAQVNSITTAVSQGISEFYQNTYVALAKAESVKKDLSKSLNLIIAFSAPSLLDSVATTQCENIQATILQNIVENWQYVLVIQERMDKNIFKQVAYNTLNDENKINEFSNKIGKLKVTTGIATFDQKINLKDQTLRTEILKKLKTASQQFVELFDMLNQL